MKEWIESLKRLPDHRSTKSNQEHSRSKIESMPINHQTLTNLKSKARDSKSRSMMKALTWRLFGVLSLGIVAWMLTGNIEQTSAITFAFNVLQLGFYYLHERMWDGFDWGRRS